MWCVKIFDRFVPCLKDVNGKVTLMALSVLYDILPCVGPHITNVVSLTVSTVAANLASSNHEIHDAASQALDQLTQLVGMSYHLLVDLVRGTVESTPVFSGELSLSHARPSADG